MNSISLFVHSISIERLYNFMFALTEQAVQDNLFSIASDRRVSSFVLQSFVAGSSDARCLLVVPCSFIHAAMQFRICILNKSGQTLERPWQKTRRRMARERRGAGSSLVSMEARLQNNI